MKNTYRMSERENIISTSSHSSDFLCRMQRIWRTTVLLASMWKFIYEELQGLHQIIPHKLYQKYMIGYIFFECVSARLKLTVKSFNMTLSKYLYSTVYIHYKAIILLKCTYNQLYLSMVLLSFKGFTMHLIQLLVHHCHEINST